MKTTEITPSEIFEKGQVLTLAKAKEMVGKTIAITSSEYRANTTSVRIFTIAKFQSEWDLAAEQSYCNDNFKSRQDYLKSYMTQDQIAKSKSRLYLIDSVGELRASAEMNIAQSFYSEPTFTGSDADREVYFIIPSIVEKHTVVFEKIIKDNRPNPISSAAKFLKSINHNDFTFETTTDMWAALTFNTEKEAQVIKTNLESCGYTVDVYSYGTPNEN